MEIMVILTELLILHDKLETVRGKLNVIRDDFVLCAESIDWEIKSKAEIDRIIENVAADIMECCFLIGKHLAFLKNTRQAYLRNETKISGLLENCLKLYNDNVTSRYYLAGNERNYSDNHSRKIAKFLENDGLIPSLDVSTLQVIHDLFHNLINSANITCCIHNIVNLSALQLEFLFRLNYGWFSLRNKPFSFFDFYFNRHLLSSNIAYKDSLALAAVLLRWHVFWHMRQWVNAKPVNFQDMLPPDADTDFGASNRIYDMYQTDYYDILPSDLDSFFHDSLADNSFSAGDGAVCLDSFDNETKTTTVLENSYSSGECMNNAPIDILGTAQIPNLSWLSSITSANDVPFNLNFK